MSIPFSLSIVIPAKNEARGLESFLNQLRTLYIDADIIVVNDGSNDLTAEVAQQAQVRVVNHPYSMGNGAAIKNGARHAKGEVILFMDADGQHQVSDVDALLQKYQQGFDMVVGSRTKENQADSLRWVGNYVFNTLASWIVGQPIPDLTSGLRVVNAKKFKQFLFLLPNGFSYPTTITMAFFRSAYKVAYQPITTAPRIGKSHIRVVQDGIKFLLIIYKMTILFSPLKIFVPIAVIHFILALINYAHSYITEGRFTNMSALLLSMAVFIFMMGLLSEQLTSLMYAQRTEESS